LGRLAMRINAKKEERGPLASINTFPFRRNCCTGKGEATGISKRVSTAATQAPPNTARIRDQPGKGIRLCDTQDANEIANASALVPMNQNKKFGVSGVMVSQTRSARYGKGVFLTQTKRIRCWVDQVLICAVSPAGRHITILKYLTMSGLETEYLTSCITT